MWSENHGISGFHGKHDVAHRGHHGIGDGSHRGNDAHGLGYKYHIGLGIFADDASGLLALQAVPDDPRLTLVLENLILIDADAGLIDSHARQRRGIVIDILANAFYDGIHLLLRKQLEDRLRSPGPGYELLDLVVFGCCGFLNTMTHISSLVWT